MADEAFWAWFGQASYQDRLQWLNSVTGGNPSQDQLNNLLVDEVKRQYGYLSTYMDDPEIGPILRQAAAGGWTQDRLQAELYKTNWWKTTSAKTREWDLLGQSDPAEQTRQIDAAVTDLKTFASSQGIADKFDENGYQFMARAFLRLGYDQAQIQQAVIAHAGYVPGQAPPQGAMGLTMQQVKTRAGDFGLQMSDQAAYQWSQQVAMGAQTADDVDVYLREQAKSRYSWLAPDLDRGATVKQLFDPMIQQTAGLLEISPQAIDLTDPKYSPLIDHVDSTGTRRSMTSAEAATYIRQRPEWQTTTNARQAAAGVGEEILKTFGKVAS